MKLLERAFLLLFTAVVTQAQNSKPEDTLLYDTSGSSDYVKVGGKIPLKEPLHFYDETFKTVYVSRFLFLPQFYDIFIKLGSFLESREFKIACK